MKVDIRKKIQFFIDELNYSQLLELDKIIAENVSRINENYIPIVRNYTPISKNEIGRIKIQNEFEDDYSEESTPF